jgi:hypothetical protein
MGKAAKRKTPLAAVGRKETKANPFESLSGKQKFHIVGRTTGKSVKNVNKARSEAVDRVCPTTQSVSWWRQRDDLPRPVANPSATVHCSPYEE